MHLTFFQDKAHAHLHWHQVCIMQHAWENREYMNKFLKLNMHSWYYAIRLLQFDKQAELKLISLVTRKKKKKKKNWLTEILAE